MTKQTGSADPARGHVVLASADSDAFTSLRRRSTSRRDRYQMGKKLRRQVPRSSLGKWSADRGRPDPVQLIIESHDGRLDWLIPVRVGRMTATPYGFLRGAAVVMAADAARLPSTGITPVICGDAHLGNFGFYASPERDLVIDLNDFDEAHPGAWEWDLRRLVASIWVAGRQNGASEQQCESAVLRCVAGYRAEVRDLASMPLLARSYQRIDVGHLQHSVTGKSLRAEIKRAAAQARRRTSDRALPRFTSERDGQRRIVEDPPLLTRINYAEADQLARGLDEYLATLAPHWRRALGGYTLIDIAHKVVGVGSVGLRAYVALLEGSSPDDVLFLQLKQARRSVLARHVHGDSAWHAHQGQRVVEYQQALQTVSDPLLGWTTVGPAPVLRPPVPEHEGQRRGGLHRRRGPGRLRRRRRSPAGQGPRPDQRRLHDRRVRRVLRPPRHRPGPVRPALRRPDRSRSRRPGQGSRPGHRAHRARPISPSR